MSDRIEVRGIRVHGRHGVLPGERERPQPFEVDVELKMDLSEAAATDDLTKTIDYATVAREVRGIVETTSFALIEALAAAVADRLLTLGAREAKVRVCKPAAATMLGATEVAVRIERKPAD